MKVDVDGWLSPTSDDDEAMRNDDFFDLAREAAIAATSVPLKIDEAPSTGEDMASTADLG